MKPITLQSLLRPEALARLGSGSYRFCGGKQCEVVYFAESGDSIFSKGDLTVRVGIKETTPNIRNEGSHPARGITAPRIYAL